ncbi:Hypothetical_protein [Hexamita inflata]|uniref:Hypothetical_protein n=1 Tax=Hexamita inflata TaxID=28002 RepID=A0ABP1IKI1_9EUKA
MQYYQEKNIYTYFAVKWTLLPVFTLNVKPFVQKIELPTEYAMIETVLRKARLTTADYPCFARNIVKLTQTRSIYLYKQQIPVTLMQKIMETIFLVNQYTIIQYTKEILINNQSNYQIGFKILDLR